MDARLSFFLLLGLLQVSVPAADAVYVPARDYFSTLTSEINKARSSVIAAVYLFALYPGQSEARTTKLADALSAAKKRGCAVRIVLDKAESPDVGDASASVNANNRMAYEYLRARGIDVYFADVAAVMHAKAVIIDSAAVLVGSTNWSEAAFSKNTESNILVRSRDVAAAALAELGKIPALAMKDQDTAVVRIPMKFLTDTARIGRMVYNKDDRALDVYLLLLKYGCARPETTLVFNYDTLGKSLGMDSLKPLSRRQKIYQTCKRLRDTYRLIEDYTQSLPNIKVRIKALPGEAVSLPDAYFSRGWDRQLDFPGKVMEMLGLYYSSISPIKPRWSFAIKTIAQRHGFDDNFVSKGTTVLRRKNLVDVEYFEWPQEGEDPRHPNVYMPLPLYDPAALAAAWLKLEAKYGREKTGRARTYAGLVCKDCDAITVEKLIGLEEKYGTDKMEKAAKIIGAIHADNPRRSINYFFGIVGRVE